MKKSTKNSEDKKAKTSAQFQGDGRDEIEVIPAKPPENIFDRAVVKRVAIYARVSTDSIEQSSSSELQKDQYANLSDLHPNWRLAGVYSDEGVSGTSVERRDEFQRMIADCVAGKIDLVVTKSISRFARNTVDCLNVVRKLKALKPPIGILFEAEGIHTLTFNGETLLALLASVAQNESNQKSEAMNWSLNARFRQGDFLTPPPLGFDLDNEGKLVVNEEEAKTVRLVFYLYLSGCSCRQIAETLTKLGRASKKNNTEWSPESISYILQNERYCGDVLAWKTYTPDFLDHKSRKNKRNRPQYRKEDHHEAIVSRDDFRAVQQLIKNAKYGHKGALPELMVVPDGALRGFVSINTRWGDFTAPDYLTALAGVRDKSDASPSKPAANKAIKAKPGDVDFRGLKIIRASFFDMADKPRATFSPRGVGFNSVCVQKLGGVQFVELLFHPTECVLAVRPSSEASANAVKWANMVDGKCVTRAIAGKAFMGVLHELCGWNSAFAYRARGVCKRGDDGSVLLFNMRGAEVFIPKPELGENDFQPLAVRPNKSVVAHPAAWAEDFGDDFYRHQTRVCERAATRHEGLGNAAVECRSRDDSKKLNTTRATAIPGKIKQIIRGMGHTRDRAKK